MAQNIHVHFLPSLTTPGQLTGGAVVVIDVLRASTTIVHALVAGAREVIPCLEVDEARRVANQLSYETVLGGERGGLPIDGFDLGNSPGEYTPESVGGRAVVFTTTNGTRAMMQCRPARRVLIGGFVNFTAVCREVADERDVHLLCAGTRGEITHEDVLAAGMIAVDLTSSADDSLTMNDQAQIAADAWRTTSDDLIAGIPLAQILANGRGGRNLWKIGLGADIEIAARIDAFDVVPELNVRQWRIRMP